MTINHSHLYNLLLLYTGIFFVSLAGTGVLRHFALSRSIIDIPNNRSSHSIPTPRGGGIAIVILFAICIPLLKLSPILSLVTILIAAIGFYDDLKSASPLLRLVCHFSAAILWLYYLHGAPSFAIGSLIIPQSLWLNILAAIYLVWMTNLYNFMDGINGIAGLQSISVCLGILIIYLLSSFNISINSASNLLIPPILIMVLSAGFLFWNFPKAKIFMGDAGSGVLGFLFGALSLQAAHNQPTLLWSWLILLGVFIVDATYTVCERAIKREPVFEAHCSHAYQHAARIFQSHTPVSIAIVCINLFWLLPNAIAVSLGIVPGIMGLIIAYIPIIILVFLFKM